MNCQAASCRDHDAQCKDEPNRRQAGAWRPAASQRGGAHLELLERRMEHLCRSGLHPPTLRHA